MHMVGQYPPFIPTTLAYCAGPNLPAGQQPNKPPVPLCAGADVVLVLLTAAVVDEAEIEEAAAAKQVAADRAAAAAAGPTRVVHLTRPPEIEEVRRQLPIIGLEQEIMEGINHNDVVVSAGFAGLLSMTWCVFARSFVMQWLLPFVGQNS
jgi:hypothetical protein